jgi:hypothetical protein
MNKTEFDEHIINLVKATGKSLNEMRDRFGIERTADMIIQMSFDEIHQDILVYPHRLGYGETKEYIAMKIIEEVQADLWRQEKMQLSDNLEGDNAQLSDKVY